MPEIVFELIGSISSTASQSGVGDTGQVYSPWLVLDGYADDIIVEYDEEYNQGVRFETTTLFGFVSETANNRVRVWTRAIVHSEEEGEPNSCDITITARYYRRYAKPSAQWGLFTPNLLKREIVRAY